MLIIFTINDVDINRANIDVVTLSGQITGTSWSITPEGYASFTGGITLGGNITGTNWKITSNGVATFGGWSFDSGTIENGGNYIKLRSDGGITLNSANVLNIFANDTVSIACDLGVGGDLNVVGSILFDGKNLSNELTSLNNKINQVVEENRQLEVRLDAANKLAMYYMDLWNNHECPEPDSGGSGESAEPSGPSNNT